ncbi:MAG: hypothetical protein HY876_10240 [Coriobacteriales bacterium]|nr:hypothetical protein [Coriobacteriales bacterium]
MPNTPNPSDPQSWMSRLTPRASIRAQLLGAAFMWSVGAGILLIRGAGYLFDRYWHAWLLAVAVVLGVTKSRVLLDRIARKAVARIRQRGRACFFGFFSVKSWMFVVAMMGSGILLRSSGLPRSVLAVVYIGVGTALVLADRIFWHALLFEARGSSPKPGEAPAE